MEPLLVGLVADPASPTDIARRFVRLHPDQGRSGHRWDVEFVSQPFTTGSEDVGVALARLAGHAEERGWDAVVGLTELPLRDEDGRYLLAEADGHHLVSVLSLPALGGFRRRARTFRALHSLIVAMAEPGARGTARVPLPRLLGRARLLRGMVLANRPWLLVPGLKSALVAALTTGAIATINSTVWLLADSLSTWRLVVATFASIALLVVWLVVDGELWDRPEDDSATTRERARLYNTATVVTLTAGVVLCYVVLYLVNLLWALFVLDPEVMGESLGLSLGYNDLLVLTWLVASAATVGGALGTGLESDEAIRAAAYSKREEDRRGAVHGAQG